LVRSSPVKKTLLGMLLALCELQCTSSNATDGEVTQAESADEGPTSSGIPCDDDVSAAQPECPAADLVPQRPFTIEQQVQAEGAWLDCTLRMRETLDSGGFADEWNCGDEGTVRVAVDTEAAPLALPISSAAALYYWHADADEALLVRDATGELLYGVSSTPQILDAEEELASLWAPLTFASLIASCPHGENVCGGLRYATLDASGVTMSTGGVAGILGFRVYLFLASVHDGPPPDPAPCEGNTNTDIWLAAVREAWCEP